MTTKEGEGKTSKTYEQSCHSMTGGEKGLEEVTKQAFLKDPLYGILMKMLLSEGGFKLKEVIPRLGMEVNRIGFALAGESEFGVGMKETAAEVMVAQENILLQKNRRGGECWTSKSTSEHQSFLVIYIFCERSNAGVTAEPSRYTLYPNGPIIMYDSCCGVLLATYFTEGKENVIRDPSRQPYIRPV